MFLAHVLNVCEDEFICDLAETYGILDYKELRVSLLATLCFGLDEDSRVKKHISGLNISRTTMLLSASLDALNFLAWTKTKDSHLGIGKPKSVLKSLTSIKSKSDVESYESVEDWEKAKNEIIGE